jgi:hypothetical protein
MAKNREVYGLPMPPQVSSVRRDSNKTLVITTMKLDEVTAFYRSRLKDYEILTPGKRIRVLGLRDYMPEISGRKWGGTVQLYYWPGRIGGERQAGGGDAGSGQDDASQSNGNKAIAGQTKPLNERKKGEPVRDRTRDGELLAPGARWGEPYTPPPGTPLHKERYRSNWGKPYGEWVAY